MIFIITPSVVYQRWGEGTGFVFLVSQFLANFYSTSTTPPMLLLQGVKEEKQNSDPRHIAARLKALTLGSIALIWVEHRMPGESLKYHQKMKLHDFHVFWK